MSSIVPSEGPRDARIVIIGECPGATEEREGRPFIGGAGMVLNGLLADAHIARESCYITNVVKVRPPANKFSWFYEKKKVEKKVRLVPKPELQAGIEELHGELRAVAPNVIVPLGNEALKAVMGLDGITDWRGSILESPFGKVIPTYHPAAIMRMWPWRPVARLDFLRVAEQAAFPEVRRKERVLKIMPTFEEIEAAVRRLMMSERVAFDIETDAKQVTAIAFSDSPDYAICIPFWFRGQGSMWNEIHETEIWGMVRALLEAKKPEKIAQNAQYDMAFLADVMGIKTRGLWMDTMVAQHTCYSELPASLAFLCSIYTDQPYYKNMIDTDDAREYFTYNALDACVTFEVATKLEVELRELGLADFYWTHSHQLIQPLMEISQRGVKIDVEARKAAAGRFRQSVSEAQRQLDELVGHPLNVSSNKQMCEWLYAELKLPRVAKRRVGGASTPSADDEALRELQGKLKAGEAQTSQAIELVLQIRADQKVLSTYLTPPIGADGRTRCSYRIHGTETGRLSSSKYYDGVGGNLQNVPKGICRQLFIPGPGNVFVEADLSQAEARVVAYLAEEMALVKAFDAGGDIHRANAARMFSKQESEVSYDERQLAKRAVHGLNYGMGVRTFAKNCGISEKEARRVRALYFSLFPGIELWHQKTAYELRKSRVMVTPFGRKRIFLSPYSEQLIKEALAFVPQSTVGDITNAALVRLHEKLPRGCHIALTVHDSIVVECPRAMREEVKHLLIVCMTIPLQIHGRELVIPVDSKILKNWNDELVDGEDTLITKGGTTHG